MITFFPKLISNKATTFYFVTLALVSVLFTSRILPLVWVLFGVVEVCSFFYFSNLLTIRWRFFRPDVFMKKLFWTALTIRMIYMVFVYFFYDVMTGQPFMFYSADEQFYYDMGKLWSERGLDVFRKEMTAIPFSDSGEIYWAAFLCKIMGPYILTVRIGHCLMSALTCVLIYDLSIRHFGEAVARMSAIFCMLMPNLIYYCGIHLKEADMVFLIVLFIDSVDRLLLYYRFELERFAIALLSLLALFSFRTVLGMVGIMATLVALLLVRGRLGNWWKRIAMIVIVAVALSVTTIGNRIMGDVNSAWEGRGSNQSVGMAWRAEREGGNSLAKYASQTIFAPLIFTLPFPTMVETPYQENQQMLHGGNYVKNVMSGFVIYALVMLIMNGNWRKHVLPIAIMGGYLFVIAYSNFAHSERFHQPALPFELMFAAVGVSLLKAKHLKFVDYWLWVLLAANIGWAWFKLAGRGML